MDGPTASITLKLLRANDHLQAIRATDATFGSVECQVIFTEDQERGLDYFVVHLPKPPPELNTTVGDCLHNLSNEWGDAVGVASLLEEVRDYIADTVLPPLEPFLNRSLPRQSS